MVNILAWILDSERNFSGFADLMTANPGFIQFLGQDFGFWLLGSPDRGSQRSPGNVTFSLLCAGRQAVEKMTWPQVCAFFSHLRDFVLTQYFVDSHPQR